MEDILKTPFPGGWTKEQKIAGIDRLPVFNSTWKNDASVDKKDIIVTPAMESVFSYILRCETKKCFDRSSLREDDRPKMKSIKVCANSFYGEMSKKDSSSIDKQIINIPKMGTSVIDRDFSCAEDFLVLRSINDTSSEALETKLPIEEMD